MNAPFAGTLRNRIRFDRPARSRDRGGERVKTWEPAFRKAGDTEEEARRRSEAWAQVRAQTGKDEAIVSGGELPIASYDIQLRYRTDITPDMSVVLPDGMRLDILSEPVDPDGTRERTLIRCEYRGGAA